MAPLKDAWGCYGPQSDFQPDAIEEWQYAEQLWARTKGPSRKRMSRMDLCTTACRQSNFEKNERRMGSVLPLRLVAKQRSSRQRPRRQGRRLALKKLGRW